MGGLNRAGLFKSKSERAAARGLNGARDSLQGAASADAEAERAGALPAERKDMEESGVRKPDETLTILNVGGLK